MCRRLSHRNKTVSSRSSLSPQLQRLVLNSTIRSRGFQVNCFLLRAQQSSKRIIFYIYYRYSFTYVNICFAGRCNDSTIFQKSSQAREMVSSPFLLEKTREACGVQVPVLLIGDYGFRFSQTLIKPYPFSTTASEEQLNFNYNLFKARRLVENAFGHLKARFRFLGKGLHSHYKNNNGVILACCILHNILNEHNSAINET